MAPAIIHKLASALIFSISLVVEVSCRLKTLKFRSFHTSQIISMAKLRIAFFGTPGVVAIFSHQVSALSLGLQAFGVNSGYAIQSTASCQIFLVYLHSASRWCADSSTVRHRGQEGECGQPLRANLLDVHTRFWMISQTKNLHFGGAHVF